MSDDHARPTKPRALITHPSADQYGSDLQMLESARALSEDGWSPIVVVPSTGPLVNLADDIEVRFVRVQVLRKSLLTLRGIVGFMARSTVDLFRTHCALRRLQPDLVYVNTLTIPIWIFAARLCRIPILVHVHEAEESQAHIIRTALASPLLLADTVVVNSKAAAKTLLDVIPRLSSKVIVVYNGIPDNAVEREEEVRTRVAFIGRLSPRKGVDVALEAVALLASQGIDITLDVYGSVFPGYEQYDDGLKRRAAAPDLTGRVNFRGYVRPVTDVLRRATLLVIPSRAEPFGNVAVEALLAECPVVASNVQGLREVVSHGRTGILVSPDDPMALASEIRSCLENPDAARERARKGRLDALERFSESLYRKKICSTARQTISHLDSCSPTDEASERES